MGDSMADKTLFCTGAGGFIGRYILAHYLEERDCDIYLLENGRFKDRLETYLDETVQDPKTRARVRVLAGDITEPGLGIDAGVVAELTARTTHVIHLAALYSLSAPRDVSVRVNVDGTRNLLDFIEGMPALKRLGYISTVAVVGTHTGIYREDELDVGQKFKNYYEETKYLAEQLVRERCERIPSVIFRPATVVGHSVTGAIEKIDGPYYALTMIARNMQGVVPNTGDIKFQFAPVDFITDAVYRLFEDEESVGKVFHLVDPAPLSYLEFIDLASEAMGKRKPFLKLPSWMMRRAGSLPMFERLTGVPPEAFEHSFYRIEYDRSQVAPALAKHHVVCPSVTSYLDVMVEYFMQHAADPSIRKGDWKALSR